MASVQVLGQPGAVVGHDHEVTRPIRAVDHEIREQRFGVEAEPLERGDRPPLIDGHLRDDLAQTQLRGCACGSSGAAVCGAMGVITWERGRGEGARGR